jgi:hypothetical protein
VPCSVLEVHQTDSLAAASEAVGDFVEGLGLDATLPGPEFEAEFAAALAANPAARIGYEAVVERVWREAAAVMVAGWTGETVDPASLPAEVVLRLADPANRYHEWARQRAELRARVAASLRRPR